MPTPKNITKAATNKAVSQGLTVKTVAPVKATKATAAKTVSKTAKAAPTTKVAPAKAVKKVTAGRKPTPAVVGGEKELWATDTDRTTAHRAVTRHVYATHSAGNMHPVKGAQSYWAEAKEDIKRYNKVIITKGTYLLAFDVDDNGDALTMYFNVKGAEVFRAKTDDDAKIDLFTYFD